MKYLLTITLLIMLLVGTCQAWTITRSFDDGTVGELAMGDDGYDYAVGSSDESRYSDVRSVDGTQSARITFVEGSTGSPGSDHTTGGEVSLGGSVGEDGEIWVRYYNYFESGWLHTCSPVYKFVRIYVSDTTSGYDSLTGTSSGVIELSYEPTGYQDPIQVNSVSATMPSIGAWHCFEFYVKLHHTAGSAIARLWIDGILVGENTATANLSSSSGYASSVLFYTYWNGNHPQTQYASMDAIVITNEQPSNLDAYGNYMIGPINWQKRAAVRGVVMNGGAILH